MRDKTLLTTATAMSQELANERASASVILESHRRRRCGRLPLGRSITVMPSAALSKATYLTFLSNSIDTTL